MTFLGGRGIFIWSKGLAVITFSETSHEKKLLMPAEVAIDGVSGDAPILDVVEAMTREASFLLRIQNKSPDLTVADLSRICANSP